MEAGVKVCAVITDDHPSNVNASSRLRNLLDNEKKSFIYHPAYAFSTKNISIFKYDSFNQKHHKQSAESK